VGPVGLESLGHPFLLVHRSHLLVALRHPSDGPKSVNVTGRPIMQAGMSDAAMIVPDDVQAPRARLLLAGDPRQNGSV